MSKEVRMNAGKKSEPNRPKSRVRWDKDEQFVAVGHLIGELEKDGYDNLQDLDYTDMAMLAECIIVSYNKIEDSDKPDFIEFATEEIKKTDAHMEQE